MCFGRMVAESCGLASLGSQTSSHSLRASTRLSLSSLSLITPLHETRISAYSRDKHSVPFSREVTPLCRAYDYFFFFFFFFRCFGNGQDGIDAKRCDHWSHRAEKSRKRPIPAKETFIFFYYLFPYSAGCSLGTGFLGLVHGAKSLGLSSQPSRSI